MQIRGKTVLVTGSGQRIGREIALYMAGFGAHVLIHYHRSRIAALKLKEEILAMGCEAVCLKADFGSSRFEKVMKNLLAEIRRLGKNVDILINNASVFYPVPLKNVTEARWNEFQNINLKAPFMLAAEIGRGMAERGAGKIINLIDAGILKPSPEYLPYAVAKAGLQAATVGLARALAPHVQVNSIAPGPILPVRGARPNQIKKAAAKTLLKKFGTPADILAAVHFLIQGTDFVTGAWIPVDGGQSVV